jgi:hypothetical protein
MTWSYPWVAAIKVTRSLLCAERYSHVMHIVSNVEGTLNEGMTGVDVNEPRSGWHLGAPGCTPWIIDQLEPTKRGLYGGACGYLSYAGDMDRNHYSHRHHQGPDLVRAGGSWRGGFGARTGGGRPGQGAMPAQGVRLRKDWSKSCAKKIKL